MITRPITTKIFIGVLPLLGAACTGNTIASSNLKGGAANGIAVINSDYKSTSVSLIDPERGGLAQDDCLDSGAVTPVLSIALSGDVVLPSQPQAHDELVLIDRTNSALAFLDSRRCQVLRQLSVGTGFYSNPHDVISLSAEKAYVTRYEHNQTPSGTAGANDEGTDILIIDPSAPAIRGRIDLSQYATTVTLEARPDRALLANGKVYVALGNTSHDFLTIGTGRLVIVDPNTDQVNGTLDLPAPFKGCTGLDYIASSKTLLVGCSGDYNDAAQTAQSGLLVYDLGGESPILTKTIPASAVGGRPLSTSVFAAVSDHQVILTTPGDFSGTPPDTLWSIDLVAGTGKKIGDGGSDFVFGGLVVDSKKNRVYLTDAAGAFTVTGSFDANPKSGLAPRQIGWY
jgi:hypothetical protein